MRSQVLAVSLVLLFTGCGMMGGNSAANNSTNGKNANSTNGPSPSPDASSTPDVARDTSPLTMSVSEMVEGSGDKDKEGRMVTVSDGVLENISYDKLRIRGAYGGAAFYCMGDFSEYTSMSSRVESLAASGRSPKVTVKGVYKVASIGTGGELSPCVLSNIEKP